MLGLVVGLVAWIVTGRINVVLGALLLVVGAFLGDQATHLGQEDHAEIPPTWIERQQQKHRVVFVVLGLVLAGLGMWLVTR